MTLEGTYIQIRLIMLTLIGVASLIAGIRLYQQMQKGEEFESPAIRWFMGLVVSVGFIGAVDALIMRNSGGLGAAHFFGLSYANELYQAALLFGVAVAVIGLVRVYKKFRDGDDDTYDFMVKWFGSLLFLFLMGWIIDAILGSL